MDDDELIVNEIINCEKGLLVDILDADLNLYDLQMVWDGFLQETI